MSRFKFGAKVWPGIAKLVEELGEVIQVCGKLMMLSDIMLQTGEHWSGNLKTMIEDELGDALAAINFVRSYCELDNARIVARYEEKIIKFKQWHREQQD
jgi:NTP pyrophosphatase (non-canonical NTP hydrolase)